MSQEHIPAKPCCKPALGLGGFQPALSRIINAKPRSKNSILSPALQPDPLGKVRFMKAMVWGCIHILYLYILTPIDLQKRKIQLMQNQMLDMNLLR